MSDMKPAFQYQGPAFYRTTIPEKHQSQNSELLFQSLEIKEKAIFMLLMRCHGVLQLI